MATYTQDDLIWTPRDNVSDEATVKLKRGDRAFHPASTTRFLYGPMTVVYRRFHDGGIDYETRTPTASAKG
jgi:hypothetical protein